MKTTLELPDELMREVKIRAAARGQKLKDTVAQLLELGLSQKARSEHTIRVPKPITLKGNKQITISDIESAIEQGRE